MGRRMVPRVGVKFLASGANSRPDGLLQYSSQSRADSGKSVGHLLNLLDLPRRPLFAWPDLDCFAPEPPRRVAHHGDHEAREHPLPLLVQAGGGRLLVVLGVWLLGFRWAALAKVARASEWDRRSPPAIGQRPARTISWGEPVALMGMMESLLHVPGSCANGARHNSHTQLPITIHLRQQGRQNQMR